MNVSSGRWQKIQFQAIAVSLLKCSIRCRLRIVRPRLNVLSIIPKGYTSPMNGIWSTVSAKCSDFPVRRSGWFFPGNRSGLEVHRGRVFRPLRRLDASLLFFFEQSTRSSKTRINSTLRSLFCGGLFFSIAKQKKFALTTPTRRKLFLSFSGAGTTGGAKSHKNQLRCRFTKARCTLSI